MAIDPGCGHRLLPLSCRLRVLRPENVSPLNLALDSLLPSSKRLLALCTQKFISDLATDAFQFSKIRSSGSSSTAQIPQMGARIGRSGKEKGRSVLTLEDLSAALGDGGVNIKRPEFYR